MPKPAASRSAFSSDKDERQRRIREKLPRFPRGYSYIWLTVSRSRSIVNPVHRALESRRIGMPFGYPAGYGKTRWRMGAQQRFALIKNLALRLEFKQRLSLPE